VALPLYKYPYLLTYLPVHTPVVQAKNDNDDDNNNM